MLRRRFGALLSGGMLTTSGCLSSVFPSSRNSSGSSQDADGRSTECNPPEYQQKSNIVSDDISLHYEVSGNDDGVDFEVFTLRNRSDFELLLGEYRMAFEDTISPIPDSRSLIPGADLKFLTFGDRTIPQGEEDCLQYVKVEYVQLENPLFQDGKATVALVAPDGSQIATETFVLRD